MRYKIIQRDGRKTIRKKKDQMGEEKRDTDVGYRTIQEDGQDGQKGTIMINATQSNLERRLSETSSERQLKYPTQRALMEHFWGF